MEPETDAEKMVAMQMSMKFGNTVSVVLFEKWTVETQGKFAGLILLVIFISVYTEYNGILMKKVNKKGEPYVSNGEITRSSI